MTEDGSDEPLSSEIRALLGHYPSFEHIMGDDGLAVVQGDLEILADGRFIDTFSIRIELLPPYPEVVPKVYETAGKIPRIADRHINPDGSACLFVPDARWKHWPVGRSLVEFVSSPVYYFFLSQAFFELEGKWLFGERPHGDDGVIDYYKEELGLEKLDHVYQCIELATIPSITQSKLRAPCVCGSNMPLESCHSSQIDRIANSVPYQRLLEVMGMIRRQQ